MEPTRTAIPGTDLHARFTRIVRALSGRGVAARAVATEDDFFDDEAEAPAAADDDMAIDRDRSCRANYPLGVTG